MSLLRDQRCREWKKHGLNDRKGRRKFFHICIILWDMSSFSIFIVFNVSPRDIWTFSSKSHQKSIAPRWLPKKKRPNLSTIYPTYRCYDKGSLIAYYLDLSRIGKTSFNTFFSIWKRPSYCEFCLHPYF